MLKSIACALVLATSLPAAAVFAQPVVRSEVVRFNDLDVATPTGAETLDRRIQSAARRVCQYTQVRAHSKIIPEEYRDCLANALAGARQQVAAKTGTTSRKG